MKPVLYLVCVAAAVAALGPPVARAAELPYETTVRIGSPPRPVQVRITAEGADGAKLTASGGGAAPAGRVAVAHPQKAEVEVVRMRSGMDVAIVRIEGSGGQTGAALVVSRRGRPEILWTGRTDPHGDPGERRAEVVEVADRTGDGFPDVVVGRTRESTRICGQEETLLFPRALDPRTLQLRPVLLRRLPDSPATGEQTVLATLQSPGPERPPVLRRLVFTAASSSPGGGEDPSLVPAPVRLVDGDATTTWQEGHGGDGKWEFVTARFDGGRFPMRAIAITPSPEDPAVAATLARPRTFWLVGDRGPRLRVSLPEDPLTRPGQPYWIVPERPLHWRCLSLVLDEVFAPPGAKPGAIRAAIAEVAVYTDLDFGEGLSGLVSGLGNPGAEGAEAADLLASMGDPGLDAIDRAWDELGPLGRRRAVRAMGAHASTSTTARARLVQATADDDAHVREAAMQALASAGATASQELASVSGTDSEMGDRAIMRLAAIDPGLATRVALEVLGTEAGRARPAVRRALGRAVRDGGGEVLSQVHRWSEAAPAPGAAAAAALALATLRPAVDVTRGLIIRASREAEAFEDRWRLLQAMSQAPADDAIDAWLERTALEGDPWMLRGAAVRVLGRRKAGASSAVAAKAFADAYPRVRVAAIEAFGARPAHIEPVAVLSRRDPWPLVREAAVQALAAHSRAWPVVRAAVRDRSPVVRAAAIRTLTRVGDSEGADRVLERLADRREDADVVAAAIEHVHKACSRRAVAALTERVDRGLAPDATPDEADLATAAIGALVALGGPDAERALGRAAAPQAPPPFRQTVEQARQNETRCK
jgi:hypothetical protein